MPEDILKYCNMDDSGFLTPGSCKNNDDVYDLGIERSTALMNHASDLAHSRQIFVNVLAVVEGFRTADLPGLLAGCDKVFILLPAKNASEDIDLGNISVEIINYDHDNDLNKTTYHIDPSYNEMKLVNDLEIPLNNSCEYYTVSWNIYSYL